MGMNDREIERVVQSLGALVGEPVTGAWQPGRDRVLVGVGADRLLLVPRGPWARLHRVRQRPRNPPRPFSFQGALRAHLHGALRGVEKIGHDRVVELRFDGDVRLHLRLTGRSGGLWLLRGDEILAAYDGPAPSALPALPERPPRDDPPRFEPTGDEAWDEAAARWFGAAERRHLVDERRSRVARAVDRALGSALRLRENLDRDLEKAEQAPTLRQQADLLAANLHAVARGVDQVALTALDGSGDVVWVELDPAISPAANMERLYARARRLDRVGEHVLERMEETEARIRALRDAAARVPSADDAALTAIERLLPPEPRRAGAPDARAPWTTWTGPGGEQVLVGRNEAGNRRLTFQRARGDDFWMHVRGRPGSHVVIPAPRDRPPPLDLLLAAAQITLIAAKVPVGTAVDVQYTRVRDVRSIPGEVGRVRLASEKVLHVAREPGALVGWVHD